MSYPVRMGAINMNGSPDADGDVFIVAEPANLWNAPADTQTTQRYDIGARLDVWRYKELDFTLKGTGYSTANNPNDVLRIIKKLTANAFPAGIGMLFLDLGLPGVPLQIACVRTGLHLPAPRYNVQEFEVDFKAADPRKYTQSLNVPTVVNTTATLVNGGTVESFAQATLMANATSPFLENTAQGRITLPGATQAGTVIDFYKKQTIDSTGTIRDMASRPRRWWSLTPGANTIQTGGNWLISYRNAYI